MKEKLRHIVDHLRKRKSLVIIITAAILIELISGIQYFNTHKILEEELEKRAESELVMKAVLIKGALNSNEDNLKNHIWDIHRNLSAPDSMFAVMRRTIETNRYASGSFISFTPYYYPEKGRLFEPLAEKKGTVVETLQIAGDGHDYTQKDYYKLAVKSDSAFWVDPYEDSFNSNYITSYVTAIHDKDKKIAAVAGIDVSLKWFADTLDKRHVYPSSFNLVLTADGKIITRPSDESEAVTDHIASLINDSTVAREKSRSGRSDKIKFDSDNGKGTIFYANMRGAPHWQIAVVCYDKEAYASLSSLRLHMLLMMLLAFGALLFMVWLFARNDEALKEKTIEQRKMDNELHIAHSIQQALLPVDTAAQTGALKEVGVRGCLIPAKAVGGDLYNEFVRDDKLFFCIGDVSGKGVPSALIMAIMQSVFRTIASRENNPAHIVTQLNEMACRNNKENIFVTSFVGVLDLPTGRLRYCNAGHEKPIVIKKTHGGAGIPATTCELLNTKPNLPIGLFDDFKYEMQETYMEKDTTLFLYTDGLTEARNIENKQYSRDRATEVLAACESTDPQVLTETTIREVTQFSEGTEQSDDLTLLAVSYTPAVEPSVLDEEITLQNDVSQVKALNSFVKESLRQLGVARSLANKLRLAVEEAVVNVMEYAYPSGITGDINVRLTSNGKRVKFIITDSGVSFNPTEAATADTTLTAEERPVGGLGILLVRNLMDSINYERIDGKNVLTLRKDYQTETSGPQ